MTTWLIRYKLTSMSMELVLSKLKYFSVLVFFDPVSYTVTEGEDEFAIMRLNRSGNTHLTTNLTFMTVRGTADGMVYIYACIMTLDSLKIDQSLTLLRSWGMWCLKLE